MSKPVLEQRFNPSNNRIEFLCGFGFQGSMEDYIKAEIRGMWAFGSCIIDVDRKHLYLAALSRDYPEVISKAFLRSIDLRGYDQFSIKGRDRSALERALSALSNPMNSQLMLASRAKLPEKWSGETYPVSRVVINFETSLVPRLTEYFSALGFREAAAHAEVDMMTIEMPYDPLRHIDVIPLRRK